MLHIFSKKHYLKDLLEDFVDIHCHILPGIDDGSKSIEESLILLKKMELLGFKQIIATPHIMQGLYPNDELTIGNAFQNLISELRNKKRNTLVINPAAEYMIDTNFEHLIDKEHLFTLKENFVLIEMSYLQPPINLKEIINKIILKGYIPVLAHPERYSFYHDKKEFYKDLKQYGCLLQMNLLSLSNYYGPSVQKIGHFLLENKLIDFIASDIHSNDHIDKISEIILSNKQIKYLQKIINNTKTTFLVS